MKKIIILTAVALCLVSCAKQLDIDFKYQKPKLIVTSLNEGTDQISFDLTQSKPIYGFHSYEDDDYPKVENASATLIVNGTTRLQATHTSNHYTFNYVPSYGDRLRLEVSTPDETSVHAETVVPNQPNIAMTTEYETDEYDTELVMNITINDPAEEENYYALYLIEITEVYDPNNNTLISIDTTPLYLNCEDPLMYNYILDALLYFGPETQDYTARGFLIDDSKINGQSYTISFETVNYTTSNQHITTSHKLIFSALSHDEYNYLRCFNNDNFDADFLNLFSEPRLIYTNVEGGAGVFGVHNSVILDVNP